MECIIKGEAINLPFIMIWQIKKIIRKAKTYLPNGMVFTLLFQAACIDLSGEDKKELYHSVLFPVEFML